MANANEHNPNDFTPVIGAMDLADYVLTITSNLNVFPDFSIKETRNPNGTVTQIYVLREDSLTNIVRTEAREIYHLTYSSNHITLKKEPWRKEERLSKQLDALSKCDDLLSDIQLCKRHFHLSTRRTLYWGKKVCDLKKAIEKWHESDKNRYKDI